MKNLQFSLITIVVCILLQITSCNNNATRITLISPASGIHGQNVLTARLVWSSGCDSFNVFLGTDSVSDRIPKVASVGYPLSICASPLISGGKLFEAGVPTRLGDGDKCDWYGQYGVPQLNQNAADDKAVINLGKMENLKFNTAE